MIDQKESKLSFINSVKSGLLKTSAKFTKGIKGIFSSKRPVDKKTLDELEELLITMDIGVAASENLIKNLAAIKFAKEIECSELQEVLKNEIEKILLPVVRPLAICHKPHVMMFCGVNGNGKTTTVGKLAYQYKKLGRSVMIAACDTFRAAAVDQLKIWADRVGCSIVTGEHAADAASVAYKAMNETVSKNIDVLLIDTAGRLHNHLNLMEELVKITRVIKKCNDAAPHDTILVLDANTGGNADKQVDVFTKMVSVSGLIITKLDGTAKGGMVVALAQKYGIAVHAIGVGEGIEDIKEFSAREFAENLFT